MLAAWGLFLALVGFAALVLIGAGLHAIGRAVW
jgi:hypothetical protein